VGEHQRLHARSRRGLSGVFNRRVVVENVVQSRRLGGQHLLHHFDEVGPQHRLHVDVGAVAQCVEFRARHRVAGERGDFTFRLEAVSDRRLHWSVVGAPDLHTHLTHAELVARRHFVHLDLHARARAQVGVVVVAILRVELEHRAETSDDLLRANRAVDASDDRLRRHNPARRDDVVQVADVVAVQVREQHRGEKRRKDARCRHTHHAAAPTVDDDVLARGLYERGRAGAARIGDRASSAEQRHFHADDRRRCVRAIRHRSRVA